MANELLITQRRSFAGFFLDATVEEKFISQSIITKNPVEFGASINDHRIRQPEKYILSGRVSDIPMRDFTPDPWKNGNADTRSKSAWAILNELQLNSEPFIIESGLQRYDDMLIETITAGQTSSNGQSLDFVAECIQVIIVNTQETAVNFPEPGETEEQATGEVDRGDVQAETLESEAEKSIGLKLLQLFGIFGDEDGS